MNIGDISQGSSTSGADQLKNQRVERIATRDGNLKLGGEEGKEPHAHQDSLAISEAGRKALEASRKKAMDLDVAREALQQVNQTDEARLAEIKERLANGFYTQPDMIDQVVARVMNDLSGSDAE